MHHLAAHSPADYAEPRSAGYLQYRRTSGQRTVHQLPNRIHPCRQIPVRSKSIRKKQLYRPKPEQRMIPVKIFMCMYTLTASKNRCRICVLLTHISGTGILEAVSSTGTNRSGIFSPGNFPPSLTWSAPFSLSHSPTHSWISPQAIISPLSPDGCVLKSSGFIWMTTVLPTTSSG